MRGCEAHPIFTDIQGIEPPTFTGMAADKKVCGIGRSNVCGFKWKSLLDRSCVLGDWQK